MEIGTKWLDFDEEIPKDILENSHSWLPSEMVEPVWLYNLNRNAYCAAALLVAKHCGNDAVTYDDYKDEDGFMLKYTQYLYEDDKMMIFADEHSNAIHSKVYIKLEDQWEQVYGCWIDHIPYDDKVAKPYVMRNGSWITYLAKLGKIAIKKEEDVVSREKARKEQEAHLRKFHEEAEKRKQEAFERNRFKDIDDSSLFS